MKQNLPNSIDHFFRGAFSTNIVLFTFVDGELRFLLEEKEEVPFQDTLSLPGRLILPNEDTDSALNSLLKSLLGTEDFYKKQLRAFSDLGRHPLGRVISISYYGLIPFEKLVLPLPKTLSWHPIYKVPALSYDHNKILNIALWRFKKGLLRHPNVFELLPTEFTISEVITIYEQAFDKKVDASNFGKQVKNSNLILDLGKFKKTNIKGRPSKLFSFNRDKYRSHSIDKVQFNF